MNNITQKLDIFLKQGKVYIQPEKGEKPPKGVEIKIGPREGTYYEVKEKVKGFFYPKKYYKLKDINNVIIMSDYLELKYGEKFKNYLLKIPKNHITKKLYIHANPGTGSACYTHSEDKKPVIMIDLFALEATAEELIHNPDFASLFSSKEKGKRSALTSIFAAQGVLLHEFGHYYRDQEISAELNKQFIDLYDKTWEKSVSGYAAHSADEGFADSYGFYILKPARLKHKNLEMYEFFKNQIFKGKEYV